VSFQIPSSHTIKKKYKSHELELQQVFVGERYGRGMTLQEAPINKCQVIIKQEQFKSFNNLKTVRISFLQSQDTQICSTLAF
jgi:hypothetical protein